MRALAISIAAVTIALAWPSIVRAQAGDDRLPGRVEAAVGPVWNGRVGIGARDATETGSRGDRFRLFSTVTDLEAAAGVAGRLGVRIARTLQVEAAASYAKPSLRTSVTADAEGGAAAIVSESVEEIALGGALIVHVTRLHVGTRGVPFVMAGASYLRERHESNTLVQTGQLYELGGGLKYLFLSRADAHLRGIGVRADVRAIIRRHAISFDGRAHAGPALGASVFVRF